MSISSKAVAYIILIFSLLFIISLLKNSWRLFHADERLKTAEKKLAELKKENQTLQEKFQFYQSDQFIESQIRDKLQMAKPGETIIILPENLSRESSKSGSESNQTTDKELSNWQKWLKIFNLL